MQTSEKKNTDKIEQILKRNPDLNEYLVKGILLGLEDVASGNIKEYKPGML
jgi:hypothetical protein